MMGASSRTRDVKYRSFPKKAAGKEKMGTNVDSEDVRCYFAAGGRASKGQWWCRIQQNKPRHPNIRQLERKASEGWGKGS